MNETIGNRISKHRKEKGLTQEELAETLGRRSATEAMQMIPAGAVPVLWAELRHLKRKYGSIVLVEVESADRTQCVKITL